MPPAAEAAMAVFDYTVAAELFPARTDAGPLPARGRRVRRQPVGYGRFARAADAIRFAIEELPAELLRNTCLAVDEERFDRNEIRRLYESSEYPFARRATAPVNARDKSMTHQNSRRNPR
jgi:Arc/MetJ-type ribon-helix-helix transcriptional regulator